MDNLPYCSKLMSDNSFKIYFVLSLLQIPLMIKAVNLNFDTDLLSSDQYISTDSLKIFRFKRLD